MRILMLGINHRTCPVQIREKLALIDQRYTQTLQQIRISQKLCEVVILSTCNRTEIYIAKPSHDPPDANTLRQILSDVCQVPIDQVTSATIYREQEPAIKHLFSVITGLDSMVIGETEILGQIKKAYAQAIQEQAVGPVLHKLFQEAITFSKKARLETAIDQGRLSIGSVVVDFAKQVFDQFADKTIVSIGAGQMVGTTLRHLTQLKPKKIWIANRTPQNAQALAHKIGLQPHQGGPRALDDLNQLLVDADILLSCTGASQPIVTHAQFKKIIKARRNRPLFIIDIAIPRDIDPNIGAMKNIYLYNIDDLHQIIHQTNSARQQAVNQCQALLTAAVKQCYSQIQHRDVGVTIKQLRTKLFDLGQIENQRTLKKLATANPQSAQQIIENHTHRVINKILHLPLTQLDPKQEDAPLGFYAAALRKLFMLDHPPQSHEQTTPQPAQQPTLPQPDQPNQQQEAPPLPQTPIITPLAATPPSNTALSRSTKAKKDKKPENKLEIS